MTPLPEADEERFLALEGATLTGVVAAGDDLRLEFEGADIHFENHYFAHVGALVLTRATLAGTALALPADIDELAVRTPKQSFAVHVPLPFSVSGACEVTLTLVSGEQVVAKGQALRVELGAGIRHVYRW